MHSGVCFFFFKLLKVKILIAYKFGKFQHTDDMGIFFLLFHFRGFEPTITVL